MSYSKRPASIRAEKIKDFIRLHHKQYTKNEISARFEVTVSSINRIAAAVKKEMGDHRIRFKSGKGDREVSANARLDPFMRVFL